MKATRHPALRRVLSLLLSRRFIVVMSTLSGLLVLRWFEHLSNETFGNVMQWCVSAYIAGDTWQHHQETKADVQKTLGTSDRQ